MRRTTGQEPWKLSRGVNVVGTWNFFDLNETESVAYERHLYSEIELSIFLYIDEDNVPHIEESSANLPESIKDCRGGTRNRKRQKTCHMVMKTKNPRTAIGMQNRQYIVTW